MFHKKDVVLFYGSKRARQPIHCPGEIANVPFETLERIYHALNVLNSALGTLHGMGDQELAELRKRFPRLAFVQVYRGIELTGIFDVYGSKDDPD
jgi:hypothetical protein